MIKVIFISNDEGIFVKAKGHANYAPTGQDIVCAGVSALICSLGLYAEANGQEYNTGEGCASIKLRQNKANRAVVEAVKLGLWDIAKQYPKYVKIV